MPVEFQSSTSSHFKVVGINMNSGMLNLYIFFHRFKFAICINRNKLTCSYVKIPITIKSFSIVVLFMNSPWIPMPMYPTLLLDACTVIALNKCIYATFYWNREYLNGDFAWEVLEAINQLVMSVGRNSLWLLLLLIKHINHKKIQSQPNCMILCQLT